MAYTEMPHNGGAPAFNPAGYAYSIFVIIYTIFIVSSLAVLTSARHTAAVRLRGLGIIVTSVLALHVYVAALFIVYPLNGQYKCNTEFWYMSVILPLGIALFQAGNARLVSVTKIQAELLMSGRWSAERPAFSFKPKQLKGWYNGLSYHGKHYLWIFVALVFQVSKEAIHDSRPLYDRLTRDSQRLSLHFSCTLALAGSMMVMEYLESTWMRRHAVKASNGKQNSVCQAINQDHVVDSSQDSVSRVAICMDVVHWALDGIQDETYPRHPSLG